MGESDWYVATAVIVVKSEFSPLEPALITSSTVFGLKPAPNDEERPPSGGNRIC
jgi:hypothetical protein